MKNALVFFPTAFMSSHLRKIKPNKFLNSKMRDSSYLLELNRHFPFGEMEEKWYRQ